jgi:hypothetical protein
VTSALQGKGRTLTQGAKTRLPQMIQRVSVKRALLALLPVRMEGQRVKVVRRVFTKTKLNNNLVRIAFLDGSLTNQERPPAKDAVLESTQNIIRQVGVQNALLDSISHAPGKVTVI